MSLRRLMLAAVTSALFAGVLVGQDPTVGHVDAARTANLQWRLIGPFRGGRVLAVTGVPGQQHHFYFGSVNGGVWETRDAGRTWQPIFDSQPVGSIGALAVAPSDPSVIYVGSGEADMRSDIAQGNGMYKSADGGRSWSHIGLEDSQQIARVLVDPADPNLVYVAALGHPYAANAERGVFRSRDGGRSWQKILGRAVRPAAAGGPGWDNDTGAVDLAFEPGNPKVIYAALWQTRRTPWSVYPPSNGPGSGLFKSNDGGDSWKELSGHGLPSNPGRIGIALSPAMPNRIYAIIDADAGGMYRSDDGGANWQLAGNDTRVWGRGWYFGGVTVEPKNADVVYSCNINLFQSSDAGKTWAPVKGAPGGDDYHQLWIDPQNPERRILGIDQGTVVSLNGGTSWSSWYNQPTGQFYHVSTDTRFPYWVYGSQQDSGAAGVPSRTNTIDGISLMQFREITAGGESDNLAPDPNDPEVIYGGRVERLDTRTQQTQLVDPTLAYPNNDRRTWTLPLAFSIRDPRVLYFGNQRIYRTDDGGKHWSVISPDLTREAPGIPSNLDPATAALNPRTGSRNGVVYAIAPSRTADHDLWAGTDDGQVWRTHDEGAHWQNVTPAPLTGWSKVGIIDASHFDSETAYAAVDRHRLDDFRPYIYRTHDGGKSWTLIVSGIASGAAVNVVREDPVRPGLLYAGTEKGMYVSFDDGGQWQTLQNNLPATAIRDIDVHGRDLVIATHGRAFWILDDVTPLRQLPEVPASARAFLFKPADAIRERQAAFTGTPLPKDEPMAANPPFGATIDYYLGNASSTPVTLEIFDAAGALVRRYSTADVVPQPEPAKLHTAPEWFNIPVTLKADAGPHRFIWPLRYPALTEFSEGSSWANGSWVVPGTYRIVLTANGQRLDQPLTVVPDPRVTLPPAAYAEQLAFALDVQRAWAPIHRSLNEADHAMKHLASARGLTTGSLAKAVEAAQLRGNAISDIVVSSNPGNNWWMVPKQTTTLRFLDSAYEALSGAVGSADAAPTPDAKVSLTKLQPSGAEAVRAWDEFKARDLEALNAQLKAAGIAAIELK